MSRPKPTVVLTHNHTNKIEQILAADAIYAVFLNGKPINIKHLAPYLDVVGPKYKKSSFSNSGHAFNLAQRLNKQFNTDAFAVYALTEGVVVTEKSDD